MISKIDSRTKTVGCRRVFTHHRDSRGRLFQPDPLLRRQLLDRLRLRQDQANGVACGRTPPTGSV
jgi:hypothetical protein